jgi:hypothetical protein
MIRVRALRVNLLAVLVLFFKKIALVLFFLVFLHHGHLANENRWDIDWKLNPAENSSHKFGTMHLPLRHHAIFSASMTLSSRPQIRADALFVRFVTAQVQQQRGCASVLPSSILARFPLIFASAHTTFRMRAHILLETDHATKNGNSTARRSRCCQNRIWGGRRGRGTPKTKLVTEPGLCGQWCMAAGAPPLRRAVD